MLTTRRPASTLYREPGIALNQPPPILVTTRSLVVKRYTGVSIESAKELYR